MSDTSPIILGDENRQISELQSTTLQEFFNANPTQSLSDVGAIAPSVGFGVPEGVIHIESQNGIASSTTFGTSSVSLTLTVSPIASTLVFGTPEAVLTLEDPLITSTLDVGNPGVFQLEPTIFGFRNTPIGDFENTQIDSLPTPQYIFEDIETGGIASTAVVEEPDRLFTSFSPESVSPTTTFGNSELQQQIVVPSLVTSTAFGLPEGVIVIEDVQSIVSTSSLGTPQHVRFLIGGANKDVGGIASTLSFPSPIFEGSIFRALIYKDGEISGIGSGEAMFIAGGIRLNPSSRITTSASSGANSQITLPENPVGFISVNIDGVDRKIPFFADS